MESACIAQCDRQGSPNRLFCPPCGMHALSPHTQRGVCNVRGVRGVSGVMCSVASLLWRRSRAPVLSPALQQVEDDLWLCPGEETAPVPG